MTWRVGLRLDDPQPKGRSDLIVGESIEFRWGSFEREKDTEGVQLTFFFFDYLLNTFFGSGTMYDLFIFLFIFCYGLG